MSGFVKLYQSILDSSIWLEPDHVRITWLTMLAMADQFGQVTASVRGLAHRARVTDDACRAALEVLMAPDQDSKDPAFDGRRIEKAPDGWLVLNHEKYREMRTKKQIDTARRVQKHRDNKRVTGNDVTPSTPRSDPDQIQNPPSGDPPIAPKGGKRGAARPWRRFPRDFQPTAEHRALADELRVNLDYEMAKIRDFEFAKPRTDPDAALRTWIRTEAERQARRAPLGGGNPAADNIKRQLERVKMLEEKERREAAGERI